MKIVKNVLGKSGKNGEVGIEIEVEGDRLPPAPKGWLSVNDGSLRGPSCEYVLSNPVTREDVPTLLARLSTAYKENNVNVHMSNRAGVHVHINMLDSSVIELFNTITLYLIMEDLLVNYCGEDRVGNLFCLRGKDAEYIYDIIAKALRTKSLRSFNTDNIRYSSINLKALPVHGSLEFRAMRGVADPLQILDWVNMLLKVKDAACSFENPRQIVESLSASEEHFVDEVFGEYSEQLQCVDIKRILMDAVRRVQGYVYTADWDFWLRADKEQVMDINLIPVIPGGMRPHWWYTARQRVKEGDIQSWNAIVNLLNQIGFNKGELQVIPNVDAEGPINAHPLRLPRLERLNAVAGRNLDVMILDDLANADVFPDEDEDEEGWDDF